MLSQAENYVKELQSSSDPEASISPTTEFSFKQSGAENLQVLGDASVDLILAGKLSKSLIYDLV